jgi:hypothetical protein
MTADEHRQVFGPTPFDGFRWHQIHRLDQDAEIVETCCGDSYDLDDPEIRVSEIGERPSNLSGNSICYGCTKSTAAPAESERQEGAV